ncbi:hypothetical protein FisN_9Lh338 [Fistulifera solaris]|uniref:HMG box domain-containing protein n=1 Tax=Fistulifera solaris TaxID=1519565 RepID=A0A1Z5KL35_FISSO|nr:hypothetical protein FisN_9Lh338 [Fistulifera solaris]|eukprot:GAX27023.1 hypothetical protein FisN_9Lh338 [Fistulifera solaris]
MSQVIQPNGVGVAAATHPEHSAALESSSRSIPATVSVPTKRPKTKHKKPEGMPRRPLSAYNFFYKAERIKWLEEQKGKKDSVSSSTSTGTTNNEESKQSDFLEMGKAISQRWRMLTNEGREPYDKEAQQDLVRYHNEMNAFNMSLVQSYKRPEKAGSLSSHSRAPSLHEVSPSHGPIPRSESSGFRNQQESATNPGVDQLTSSLQMLLPLLQQNESTARLEPSAPTNTSTTVFQALGQQVIAQQLTSERLTELHALLRELEQILMLQLHLEQHFPRREPPTAGGIHEAFSALLSLVNQLR